MTRRAAQKLLRCCQTCRLSLPICSLRLAHSWKVVERHSGVAGCYPNPISAVSLPGKPLLLRKSSGIVPLGGRRVRQPLQQNRHH